MLKSDIEWPNSRRFKSASEWEPIGFFSEGLCNSTKFDLMLGFFSSSALSVLCDGFAVFLHNGGKMRLIINEILTEQDIHAIQNGSCGIEIPEFDLSNIEELKKTLSVQDRHFFECLSWLISKDKLEIRIVSPINGQGISHTKNGILSDGINRVGFDGSCNFSRTALVSNIESLTCSCDWDGAVAVAAINDINSDFDRTFIGENPNVKMLNAEDLKTSISTAFPAKDIKELLKESKDLTDQRFASDRLPNTVRRALAKARKKVSEVINAIHFQAAKAQELSLPHFPYSSGPREYQQIAFERWKGNTQKGLFAMATGTGKTITSLNCLLEIYKRNGYYKALILVPTITLVNQWAAECRKFGFNNTVKACSKNPNWRTEIDNIEFNERLDSTGKKNSYIIISTYASYARENVFRRLNIFPRRQLLFIADEAHNMGAGQIKSRLMEIPYLRRIGLSATPERQYDEETTKQIMNFFGCDKEYTYEYSMAEAIEKGVLCRYRYYPHIVQLTPSEMEEYLTISRKLAQFYTYEGEKFRPKNSPILTTLLLKRKRIIHKAANKMGIFKSILEKKLTDKGELKYTLVYVPEGNKPDEDADVFDTTDTIKDDEDTGHLIDDYTSIVRDLNPTITVKQFTSSSKDRDLMLTDFAEGKLDVLTSMKCLDEGIDVPRSELAIFCASTGNPRQFIQRRGRILRTHPDKHMAEIYDLVVAPAVYSSEETYKMERNLLLTELKRVYNFASLSENMDDTIREMEDILAFYNLSIFNLNQ